MGPFIEKIWQIKRGVILFSIQLNTRRHAKWYFHKSTSSQINVNLFVLEKEMN